MSKPNSNTRILPFGERIQMVADEISKRVSAAKPKHRDELRARLWVRWLNREVLA